VSHIPAIPIPVGDHAADFQALIPSLPPGAIAEFGVANGGSTRQLIQFGRQVYAFDTFSGMPGTGYDSVLDWRNPPGKFKPSHDVQGYLDSLGVHTFRGLFADTLPLVPDSVKFSFVYLDCDWYSGHREILTWLIEGKRMVSGGLVLLVDYALDGAHRAVDEIVMAHGLSFDGYSLIRF